MGELEPVYRALADRRRRLALDCLTDHHVLALADLAEEVSERETGTPVAELPAEDVAETYFSLYHTHVPKLENADLVMYDQEEDLVARTDEAVRALTRAREELDEVLDDGF